MRPRASVFTSLQLTATLLAGVEATILGSANAAPPQATPTTPAGPTTLPTSDATSTEETRDRVAANADPRRRVPTIDLRDVPIADVFDFIRDATGINLYVNWPALEAIGVDRSTPVTLRLRNVPIKTILDLALREASKGGPALSWYIADNIVHVTTKELSDRQLVTRVYPVQDLLIDIPNSAGPSFQLNSGSGDGGGSQQLFNDTTTSDNTDGQTPQERGEALVDLIKTLIRPEVWTDNGGYASIRYFNGTLIVTAPRDVLAQIGR